MSRKSEEREKVEQYFANNPLTSKCACEISEETGLDDSIVLRILGSMITAGSVKRSKLSVCTKKDYVHRFYVVDRIPGKITKPRDKPQANEPADHGEKTISELLAEIESSVAGIRKKMENVKALLKESV